MASCEACGGRFDPLSRQATQNAMGPWFVRDEKHPFRPGCSFETLVRLATRGVIRPDTPVRGPTTGQFWMPARWCPGLAHRLGVCHNCRERVDPGASACPGCGASFAAPSDRQHLGLGRVRALPGREGEVGGDQDYAAGPEFSPGPGHFGGLEREAELVAPDRQVVRLRRDLARARRWGLVWSVLAVLGLLVIGAAGLVRVLDLDAGPAGRWLSGGGGASVEEAGGAVLDPTPRENAGGIAEEAVPGEAGEESGGGEADRGAEGADDLAPPGDFSGETGAPEGGEHAGASERLELLRSLRRLR